MPLLAPAVDEIVALIELRDHHRDVEGVVLQVAIQRDDHVALRVPDSRVHRRRLSIVAAEADDFHALVTRSQLLQYLHAAIR